MIKRKLVAQDYNEAEQTYFTLTIGNTTWATKGNHVFIVIIAEAIDTDKIEVLQAIKRLMTFWTSKLFPIFLSSEEQERQMKGTL